MALELLGYVAQSYEHLNEVAVRWEAEHSAMLKRTGVPERVGNLEASFEQSITGPRVTESASRLLALLGYLPDGIAHPDLPRVLPTSAPTAAATLRAVGLAYDDADRLRILAPLREYTRVRHRPKAADLMLASAFYISRAINLGLQIGLSNGAQAIRSMDADLANISSSILHGLNYPYASLAYRAAEALSKHARYSGLPTPLALKQARLAAGRRQHEFSKAMLLKAEGDEEISRSEHAEAKASYIEALEIFERLGSIPNQAICTRRLGQISFSLNDASAGRSYLAESLALSNSCGDRPAIANVMKSLADLAISDGDYSKASELLHESLKHFNNAKLDQGIANVKDSLGRLHVAMSDHDKAEEDFKEAIQLYKTIGDSLGEGRSHQHIADLFRSQGYLESSLEHYSKALSCHQKANNRLNQAQSLRDIAGVKSKLHLLDDTITDLSKASTIFLELGEIREFIFCSVGLALAYFGANLLDESERTLHEVLKIDSLVNHITFEITVHNTLAMIERSRGNYGNAIGEYRKAVDLWKSHGASDEAGTAACAECFELVYGVGDNDTLAMELLEDLIQASILDADDRSHAHWLVKKFELLYASRAIGEARKALHEAADICSREIRLQQNWAENFRELGVAYWWIHDYETSHIMYSKSVELAWTTAVSARVDLAILEWSLGHFDLARMHFHGALYAWGNKKEMAHQSVTNELQDVALAELGLGNDVTALETMRLACEQFRLRVVTSSYRFNLWYRSPATPSALTEMYKMFVEAIVASGSRQAPQEQTGLDDDDDDVG